jgi:hypothetical protein
VSAAEFLTSSPERHARFAQMLAATAQMLERAWPAKPFSGASPGDLAAMLPLECCPEGGMDVHDPL